MTTISQTNTPAEAESLLVDISDGVARLTFNRPAVRNALDVAGMTRLGERLEELAQDARLGCLVIAGTGGAFCAGADLGAGDIGAGGAAQNAAMMAVTARVITAIVTAPLPVLAAVDGPAAGVGASIAFACDLVLATPRSYFLLPFTGIGLVPDGGATLTVAASVGRARALRMALRRERIGAQAAYDMGLIAGVAADGDLAEMTARWAADLVSGPRTAVARTKAAINGLSLASLPAALDAEAREQVALLDGPEFREGVTAFREHRTPVYRRPDAAVHIDRKVSLHG